MHFDFQKTTKADSLHPVVLFVGSGAVLLMMIMVKYIRTGKELKQWDVSSEFGDYKSWRTLSFRVDDGTPITPNVFEQTTGIYDRWLIVRFSIAFFFMV